MPDGHLVEIRRYRRFVTALVLSIFAHAAAVVSTLTLLAPGLDLRGSAGDRAVAVAAHPWVWRLGWATWQLTAASDLLVGASLLAYVLAVPRRPGLVAGILGVVVTFAALVPDQWGEALLDTSLVEMAPGAVVSHAALFDYVGLEAHALSLSGTWGAALYTVMGALWMVTGARAAGPATGRGLLVVLGVLDGAVFVAAALTNEASVSHASAALGYPGFSRVTLLNGAGFGLLAMVMVMLGVVVGAGHHARQSGSDHALHELAWPRPGALGTAAAAIANASGARDMARAALAVSPFPVLSSNISDVVYLNWLVPAERVAGLLPSALALDRLAGGGTVLSILTYRHGHFGPRALGPLRRLCPSPIQSNWRLYVEPESPGRGRDAIYFVKTVLDMASYVLGGRLASDGLPAHLARRIEHRRDGAAIVTDIDPGYGSAPDLRSLVRETESRTLPAAFAACFGSWAGAVRYLVEQNRAVSVHTAHGRILESRISIPISVASVLPAAVERAESRWLASIVEGCEPFAFVVPRVAFAALGEGWSAPIPP
jgi:hypothetical protein